MKNELGSKGLKLILVVTLFGVLSACSGGSSSKSPTNPSEPDSKDLVIKDDDIDIPNFQMQPIVIRPLLNDSDPNGGTLELFEVSGTGTVSTPADQADQNEGFDFYSYHYDAKTGEISVNPKRFGDLEVDFLYRVASSTKRTGEGKIHLKIHNSISIKGRVTSASGETTSGNGIAGANVYISAVGRAGGGAIGVTDEDWVLTTCRDQDDVLVKCGATTNTNGEYLLQLDDKGAFRTSGFPAPDYSVDDSQICFNAQIYPADANPEQLVYKRCIAAKDLIARVDANKLVDLTKDPQFDVTLWTTKVETHKHLLSKSDPYRLILDYVYSDWTLDALTSGSNIPVGEDQSVFNQYVESEKQFALLNALSSSYFGDNTTLVGTLDAVTQAPQSVLGWITQLNLDQDGMGTMSTSAGNIAFAWSYANGVTTLTPNAPIHRPNIPRIISDKIELRLMSSYGPTSLLHRSRGLLLSTTEQTLDVLPVKTPVLAFVVLRTEQNNPILLSEADVINRQTYYLTIDGLKSTSVLREAAIIVFNADHSFTGALTYDGVVSVSHQTWSVSENILSLQFTLSGADDASINGDYQFNYHSTGNGGEFIIEANTPLDNHANFFGYGVTLDALQINLAQSAFGRKTCETHFGIPTLSCYEYSADIFKHATITIKNDVDKNNLIDSNELVQILDGTWSNSALTNFTEQILTGYYDSSLKHSCTVGSAPTCKRKDLLVRLFTTLNLKYEEERDYDVMGASYTVTRTGLY